MDAPFWKTKSLEQMTDAEWESLCDGCGRCCLHKLRDDVTEVVSFTNVACHMLDLHSCACSDYARRQEKVPDCVSLTPGGRWTRSTGCRHPAPIVGLRKGGIWPGGIRWCRATRRPCMRPGIGARPGDQRAACRAAGAPSGRLARSLATGSPSLPRLRPALLRLAYCGQCNSDDPFRARFWSYRKGQRPCNGAAAPVRAGSACGSTRAALRWW